MNKTKIEWCSHTWNPVTGCLHGCPYCYARGVAQRFAGGGYGKQEGMFIAEYKAGTFQPPYELSEPQLAKTKEDWYREAPYPFGFAPTFHRYRLGEPERATKGRDIFVCSMADLFGKWVPVSWILEVLDAAERAPQHRYMFLTKNPARYLELDHLALLPHSENFWYGSSVTDEDAPAMFAMQGVALNTFWSMEPLLGPVDMSKAEGLPGWVIIGAETGNRRGKVAPRREWVKQIADFCGLHGIPVFYKGNIREHFPDLPPSVFPWDGVVYWPTWSKNADPGEV